MSSSTWIFVVSFVLVGSGSAWVLFRSNGERLQNFDERNDWDRQLVQWEYERLTGLSKALASAAAGFLVSLLVAAAKEEVGAVVTTLHIVGCFLGILGCLVAAARLQVEARTFARRHVGEWLTW